MAYAQLTAFPPLDDLTIVHATQTHILFTVYINWSHVRPRYPIEVVLCYTATKATQHPSTWLSVPLTETDKPMTLTMKDGHTACFGTSLSRDVIGSHRLIYATYKYRVEPRAPWLWVETQQGVHPSLIVLQEPRSTSRDLADFLTLDPEWTKAECVKSDQTSNVFMLETTTPIPQGSDHDNLCQQILGKIQNQIQYVALVRLEPYWLGPRQGHEFFYLSEDAIICSFVGNSAQVITVLAITGIDEVYSVIQSNERGEIIIASRCDNDASVPFRCVVAIADTINDSISAAMGAARRMTNDQPQPHDADTIQTSVESWCDGLTFCTWNALGQDLNQDKILSGLSSLAENGIQISNLLIDDSWQILGPIEGHDYRDPFNRGLMELTANPEVAPDGLGSLISKIKSLYPHITDIGVWHALMGYWGGISPIGNIANSYDTVTVPARLMGDVLTDVVSIAANDLPRFYDDFYSYLADSGITFVKTDVQHMLSTFRSTNARRTLISAYQLAWNTSHNRHFGGKAISCMSQVPEILFASLLQSSNPKVIARNSDDFYPEVLASHSWHIWANAHNTLFTQHLNVLPDWDMFQTSHLYSSYHAAARCISGGPITITDVPGQHDIKLLKQFTALDPSGRSIALRPNVATVIGGFTEYAKSTVLKIGTTTNAGYSLLGLWNVTDHDTHAFIPLAAFPQIHDTVGEIVVYNYRTQQIIGRFDVAILSSSEGISTPALIFAQLETRGWEILTACPLLTVQLAHDQVSVAVLGLIDKMSGAAALVSVPALSTFENRVISLDLELKAIGVLGVCILTPRGLAPSLSVEVKAESLDQKYETLHSKNTVRASFPGSCQSTNVQEWILEADLESEWHRRALFSPELNLIEARIKIELTRTS